ncbi:dynamin family protein [Aliarcobacter butzleri]|uniref:ATP-binding protein n=1 Tax=Aliarcobacter butzleri L351 TaxID=1447259 RepID=A0A837J2N9_9BACT|nr:dynamin family protein [Aliarcobacter butzleri]KLD99584.1 ATP-binding protein [Aliarcobacter butzleri L351]KLE12505.1 ATP-binding protein [Aliarcobacter butzleri L350]MDN5046341.1 dynamin family protein [Aliarcobacter butzleri]MDN5058182.1 dynamin family protein [Aliarcobacter butzleri]MDN5108625.1 dynamin family protein [Aliarcobacter butzleri]
MSLVNDYFLLYHGITFEQNLDTEEIDTVLNEDTFTIFALILSATRKNCDKYLPLTSFKTLCQQINVKSPSNITELNHLQHNIVDTISRNKTKNNITILHSSFEYLKNENILNSEHYNKLLSLFDLKELNVTEEQNHISVQKIDDEHKSSFKDLKHNLENIINELKTDLTNKEILGELENTNNYLNDQKFSIGITGVMNAGKSTMLNALMGREILGSAVVPETANLTIVKHNPTDNAKVYYWNEQEWDRIKKSASQLESMKDFVEETNRIFGDNLKNYIRPVSRFDEIDIKDLSSYTSAEASGKKCNLVKYVELGSKLDFLSDGIEIVDTPGLDDPVIQREEITKEYISQCDMMIHLMNVSQSATLKDVEFIIDALLYQNISKLLVVITRADTVSKEQLEEVIKYTKTSIEKQLKAQNKDSQLDYILKTIRFIPISGRMALLHRTGREKEALDAGFTIEDTGILEIEKYLMDTLFGTNSQKGELVVQSTKNQLQKVIEKQISFNNYELTLLSKSKEELEKELEEFNKKKAVNTRIFQAMSEDITYYKNDAKSYINSLETFLESELIDLQTVIKQRVVSDVKYSFEKMKKRPENSRIKVIVETAIKDGIIDVIRDYRYKFIKKSQSIGEQCEQKYHDLGFAIGHKNENFDARGFFQEDFKSGFLTSNNEILISQIIDAVSKSKDSKINELDREIEALVATQFTSIEDDLKLKAKKVSNMLIDSFFTTLNAPLKQFEQKLKNDEETLQNQLNSFEENDKNKDVISINIHKNIKKLENISATIKGLN